MNEKLIRAKDLKTFFTVLFKTIGVKKNIYAFVIDGLIETSLRGVDSHGIRLMPHYIKAAKIGRINTNPKFAFTKNVLSTAILDADHTYGIAAGNIAMRKAIKMARSSGIGAVAVKNSTHFGAAAIFSLLAAHNGMIGLSFTHADSLVLPFGGKEAYLGTNPICFAAPCAFEEPFCLDMATSYIPWNKLLVYRGKKQKLEPHWAADRDGVATSDPQKAVALLPIGGYKGYGLALMIEILSSLLTGMPFGRNVKPMYPLDGGKRQLGHFFIAIDIAKFENVNFFMKRLASLVKELRSVKAAKGFSGVVVPGDPEKKMYKSRSQYGIPVSKQQREEFIKVAKDLPINEKYYLFLL